MNDPYVYTLTFEKTSPVAQLTLHEALGLACREHTRPATLILNGQRVAQFNDNGCPIFEPGPFKDLYDYAIGVGVVLGKCQLLDETQHRDHRESNADKKFTAFESGDSYAPFFDERIRYKDNRSGGLYRALYFGPTGVETNRGFITWGRAFDALEFEDGRPFGLETNGGEA